jgi:homoserine dehydrogenase
MNSAKREAARPLKVGIAGLGTVGAGVLRLLSENAELITARAGRPIVVTAVSARDRTRDRGVALDGLRWHEHPATLAADDAVDVGVELIGGQRCRMLAPGGHRQQGAARHPWRGSGAGGGTGRRDPGL